MRKIQDMWQTVVPGDTDYSVSVILFVCLLANHRYSFCLLVSMVKKVLRGAFNNRFKKKRPYLEVI